MHTPWPCLSDATLERIDAVRDRLAWHRDNPEIVTGYPGAVPALRAIGALARTVLEVIERAQAATHPVVAAAAVARIEELAIEQERLCDELEASA